MPAGVLVQVGREIITAEQFGALLVRRGGADPERQLQNLIVERAAWQRAQATGRDRDPVLFAAFQRQVVEQMREEYFEAHRERLTVPEAEVTQYYAAHPGEFRLPARVQAAMIFAEAPASFGAEARQERRALLEALPAAGLPPHPGEGFGARAAELSFDQATKFKGGNLGWLVEGAPGSGLDPAVLTAIFALREPGEMSGVIEGAAGFYRVRLMERQPETVRPLAQVRGRIQQALAIQKRAALEVAFGEAMKAGIDIRIQRPEVDRAIQLAPSRSPTTPPSAPE